MVARNLYIGGAGRARDAETVRRHAATLPLPPGHAALPVNVPIGTDDIRAIASDGFPLWEAIEVLQLRNQRITLAYGNLSRQLATLVAGTEEPAAWDANWCTFATWSSKTIGNCIDRRPDHGALHQVLSRLPPPMQRLLTGTAEALLSRGHGAVYRALALGNRLVFLEMATAVSMLLDHFDTATAGADGVGTFDDYWEKVALFVAGLTQLDASWVDTGDPDPVLLQGGLRAYFSARSAPDSKRRSQYVLVANLLLGAYEQRRVHAYLLATLTFSTNTWLQRIVRGGVATRAGMAGNEAAALLSLAYSATMTRYFLVLEMPYEPPHNLVRVGRPVPPLDAADVALRFPADLTNIDLPELQALLTRYDLSDGRHERTRARNWSRYDQRMSYITNLFRSRQKDLRLFDPPWTDAQAATLLAGTSPV